VEERKYYLIYRVYGKKERPDIKENAVIYGWTSSKKMLKAFLQQRDEKKYSIFKMDKDQIGEIFHHNDLPEEKMLSILKVKSSSSGEKFALFITPSELQECEKKIQKLFDDLCSLQSVKCSNREQMYYLNLIIHLKKKYFDALEYIGYSPPELDILFPSADDMNDRYYEGMDYKCGYKDFGNIVPGMTAVADTSRLIIYSLESFIRVMKEDL